MNRTSPGYVLTFMAVLCVVCGSAVSLVHYATRDLLAANERLNHNRVVATAFGLDVPERTPEGFERALAASLETAELRDESGPRRVYRRADGGPVYWGYTFTGMGFWDRINGFIVLDEAGRQVISLRFFDHKETPGLGARIEDREFLESFEGLRVAWENDPGQRIIIGPGAPVDADYRVDALSGATQTTTSLERMLNDELVRIRAIDRDALRFVRAGQPRK